jgi:hypothetical protein
MFNVHKSILEKSSDYFRGLDFINHSFDFGNNISPDDLGNYLNVSYLLAISDYESRSNEELREISSHHIDLALIQLTRLLKLSKIFLNETMYDILMMRMKDVLKEQRDLCDRDTAREVLGRYAEAYKFLDLNDPKESELSGIMEQYCEDIVLEMSHHAGVTADEMYRRLRE